MLGTGNVVYAAENTYEYGDEGIVNESLELEIPAEAGKNYQVTVEFMGVSETTEKISLGYDMVTNDQMVPNVDGSNDRSGLIDEAVVLGTLETRTFGVAAVEDNITIKATGKGKITKITVDDYESEKAEQTVIFTIGDSLVQTYTDYYAPQTGWGQMLQDYFDESKVVVNNHALGGRSSGSFLREGRLNEVLLNVKEGDYVLIEFGHNDASKDKVDRYTSVEDYKILLVEQYIRAIEQRGGIPVLVTLVNRNDYNTTTGVFNVSFERYVVAMREVAAENNTLLIDLNAKTVEYFTNLNQQYGIGISEAIIFNHADKGEYTGAYADGVADNTHLQKYGAKLVAGMVAEGLCELGLQEFSDSYIAPSVSGEIPKAPTNLQIASMLRTYRKISWTESAGTDFYKIYVAEVEDGKAKEYSLAGHSTSGEFVYGAGDPNKIYMFKVVAVNGKGESEESEELLYEVTEKKKTDTNIGVIENEQQEEESKGLKNIVPVVIVAIVLILVAVAVILKKKKK